MKPKTIFPPLAAAAAMLLLILDSRTALEGARQGIDLCIRTVIPSLFPFFVFSGLLTGSLMRKGIPFLKPVAKLTGIPEGSESILLTGFLGGYPIGAQAIAQAHKDGNLSDMDAERMIAFCNNAGPAFLFGMVTSQFPLRWIPWLLWLIHIAGALMVAWIMPEKSENRVCLPKRSSPSLPDCVAAAIRAMASVCAWIILFRVLIAILTRWVFWMIPDGLQAVLAGILELANGCCSLRSIDNLGLRFTAAAGMLAFGGLCVEMQTASVAANVKRHRYFPGKCLHALISILLALIFQSFLPSSDRLPYPLQYSAMILLLLLLIPVKKENYSSIPGKVRV